MKENIEIQDNSLNVRIVQKHFLENNFFSKRNVFYVFLSEFAWFLITGIISFFAFKYQYYHPPKTYFSKTPKEPWNSDYTPKIFLHMTDIHISFYLGYRTNGSTDYYSDFLDYNPDLIINSGDVVDNYEESYWPKVGSQWPADWDLYAATIKKNVSKFKIIDVAGNHDLFSIDSLLSKHNYFLDHSFSFNRSNVKTYDDFVIKKVNLFNETFLLYNEYIFPIPRPPYCVAAHPTRHILDLLENAIDSSGDCYIVTHYIADRNWFITSSKGHTFKEIISKKNVKAIFNGHDHPWELMIIHHGQGAVEFCSPAPFRSKAQGLITIDNDQMVYNSVKIEKKGERPLFFMSYPIPKEQISSHHIFNYKNSEIRVISYAGKNVDLRVSGDINGKMEFKKKLSNGADLYTFPINLPFGNYTINVKGDGCDITRDFVIANEFTGFYERSICFLRSFLIIRVLAIPFFIGIMTIVLPWGGNIKLAKNVEKIIEGNTMQNFSFFQHFIFILKLIIFSPFIMRERYRLIDYSTKIYMLIFTLYPLIFPINIFKPVYGVHGYAFFCFIIIGNRIQFEESALQFTFGYYLSIIFIHVVYLSGMKYYKSYKYGRLINIINLTLMFLFWIGAIFLNIRFIGECIWWPFLFLTPIYAIIPVILKIIIFCKTYIDTDKEETIPEDEDYQNLLKNNKNNVIH